MGWLALHDTKWGLVIWTRNEGRTLTKAPSSPIHSLLTHTLYFSPQQRLFFFSFIDQLDQVLQLPSPLHPRPSTKSVMFSWSGNNSSSTTTTRNQYPGRRASRSNNTHEVAMPVEGSIRPPNGESYSRAQHLQSYVEDPTLKRSTRRVSTGKLVYALYVRTIHPEHTLVCRPTFFENSARRSFLSRQWHTCGLFRLVSVCSDRHFLTWFWFLFRLSPSNVTHYRRYHLRYRLPDNEGTNIDFACQHPLGKQLREFLSGHEPRRRWSPAPVGRLDNESDRLCTDPIWIRLEVIAHFVGQGRARRRQPLSVEPSGNYRHYGCRIAGHPTKTKPTIRKEWKSPPRLDNTAASPCVARCTAELSDLIEHTPTTQISSKPSKTPGSGLTNHTQNLPWSRFKDPWGVR